MTIYPAIDLHNGQAVRLLQGDFEKVTVYDTDPVRVARRWVAEGAEYLHLVDLDGTRYGTAHNDPTVKAIVDAVPIPVQIGGGIRTLEAIETKLAMGIRRVILGTVAVTDPEFTKRAVDRFGDAVVLDVAAANGKVSISGWAEVRERDCTDLIAELGSWGVGTIVYTDVAKDGMMAGPNLPMYREVVKQHAGVIASGGVSSIDDVRALADIGVAGVIIGKALYVDAVQLGEAIKVGKG